MTLTRRQVTERLERAGLQPSRALGQNFVADPNTVRRITVLAGVGPGSRVLEIGAGLGSLTLSLAESGARVVAVELDRRLSELLRAEVEPLGVEVVVGDALELDLAGLLEAAAPPGDGGGGEGDAPAPGAWSLVANLPYNVAVRLVVRVLEEVPAVGNLLVMVQREVGERLAASPGSAAYGAVSVKVAYHATAQVVGRVPPTVFVPRPRVESVLVRMVRRAQVAVDPELVGPERLFAVVRAGFAHRRKMLRRSLAGVVPDDAFARAGVDERWRAEQLSVEQWGRLAACG
jgi:16S rRNA (adenine1518-N6/adenine1519-N6)-dimethyltransferase